MTSRHNTPKLVGSWQFEELKPQLGVEHESVRRFRDDRLDLTVFIAVHNSNRGSALGGARIRAYRDETAALADVLKLSEGMTYKNVLAGLPFGGAKACLVEKPWDEDTRRLALRRFGEFVESFGGRYTTAEDMGSSVADIMVVREVTKHVCCLAGGIGDQSPWTARGVLAGIEAALVRSEGSPSVAGKIFAIEGIGKVGHHLALELYERGGSLVLADIVEERLGAWKGSPRVSIVDPTEIRGVSSDVYCPCAAGQSLTPEVIANLKARIVAGGANNQLAEPDGARRLARRGVLYCPDFVVNAGGVIAAAAELHGWNTDELCRRIGGIGECLGRLLDKAAATGADDIQALAVREARAMVGLG